MKGNGLWRAAVACLAVACVFAFALAAGGCGSSGGSTTADATSAEAGETAESTSPSSGPLTKAEFIKEANKICHEGLKKKDDNVTAGLKDLPPNTAQNASEQAVGKLVAIAVIPAYSETIEHLGELSVPKGDEAPVHLIIQKYEAALGGAEDDPTSAVKNNPFQAGDRAAEAYGITGCIL
jgi:hypothetical protein